MADAPIIDRAFLEKLERLALQWQQSFPGLVGGHNTSRFAGAGQEFLDHRRFHQGDDLRAVNWRAYLRLEKLFLKMFQIEPRVPVRLLLDISTSMDAAPGKFDYARRLAAALAYVGLVKLDTICLQPFHSELTDSCLCGGGRHRFVGAVNFLSGVKPSGTTNLLEVSRQFVGRYAQRGLVIVLSDFMDDTHAAKPIEYLAEFGHEVILVQVWSEQDREPSWDGEYELVDAETGQHIEIGLNAEARSKYTLAFDAYSKEIELLAQRHGGRYVGLPTTTSLEEAIFGPLARAGAVQ